ncbi:F-box domain-containing protein [Fusarium falciforme]|uniref:F-box domain-containing protein n=1 Tax=Fusarium falciforme TaxID=195108 RepID=UPI002300105B|nr:F-box domain-containing protein [Fusarium falciforme]WAO91320.1 F-box domain-containing protein [Fusarium falciforme]
MMRRDIDDGVYNSLSWACYFGNVAIGRRCLEMGASPDAAFLLDPDQCLLPFQKKPNWPDTYERGLTGYSYEVTVHPTRKLGGIPIFYQSECSSCSALSLATRRDHVGMVKLLLSYGAKVIERRRPDTEPDDFPTRHLSEWHGFQGAGENYSHEAVISHVRSIEAAEALLGAGAAKHINHTGVDGYTPLETLLSSCSIYSNSLQPGLTETQLHALVELFLKNGAQTARVNRNTGCMTGALATGYLSIVKLILEQSPGVMDAQHRQVLNLVVSTSDLFDYGDRCPIDRDRLFGALLDAGVSPNTFLDDAGPLLHTTLQLGRYRAAQMLLDRGADPNFTNASTVSPITKVLCQCAGPTDFENEFIIPLVRAGADIDQPSLRPGGFTPLMFAASDMVSDRIFLDLLALGADRGAVRRLSLEYPPTSVVQCLLLGSPPTNFDWDGIEHNSSLQAILQPLHNDHEAEATTDSFWWDRRCAKFTSLFANTESPGFYTPDGRHYLHWAIDNLYYTNLEWAVDMLLPTYLANLRPSDDECPFWSLFSVTRVEKYLAFGTLYQTLRIAEKLVNQGISPKDTEAGETILHRVCRLYQGMPDRAVLEKALSLGHRLDFGGDLTDRAREWTDQLHAKMSDRFTSTTRSWTRVPKPKHLGRYMNCRLRIIAFIVEIFMKQGVDLYSEDRGGKTAFEGITDDRILEWIPKELRDLEKEAEIKSKRVISPSNHVPVATPSPPISCEMGVEDQGNALQI